MVGILVTTGSVTIHYGGSTKVVAKEDPRFEEILSAIREGRTNDIPEIVDTEEALRKQGFKVQDGIIEGQMEDMPAELNQRIVEYQQYNIPFNSLKSFWENLRKNPSFNSRKQLFRFLENKGHSITEDGCFVGYRGVTEDFKDKHTKTFDNKPGSICEMDRNSVDDNPNNTCSNGLHVGGYQYAKDFGSGGKLVLVKVNPADVVTVPTDYNGQKMRVCRFEVLKEVTDLITTPVVTAKGESVQKPILLPNSKNNVSGNGKLLGNVKKVNFHKVGPKTNYANNHAKRGADGKFIANKKSGKKPIKRR